MNFWQPDGKHVFRALLRQPSVLPEDLWILTPQDWHPTILQGKTYDIHAAPGRALWGWIEAAIRARAAAGEWPAQWSGSDQPGRRGTGPMGPGELPATDLPRWRNEQAFLG